MSDTTRPLGTKLAGVLAVGALSVALGAVPTADADAAAIPITSTFDATWAAIDAGSLTTIHRLSPEDTGESNVDPWAAADAGSLETIRRVDPIDALPTEVLWASVEAGIIVLEVPSR